MEAVYAVLVRDQCSITHNHTARRAPDELPQQTAMHKHDALHVGDVGLRCESAEEVGPSPKLLTPPSPPLTSHPPPPHTTRVNCCSSAGGCFAPRVVGFALELNV
eukprot:355935-Chlamydomonas_euryale.AAC.3